MPRSRPCSSPLSLHDALPISRTRQAVPGRPVLTINKAAGQPCPRAEQARARPAGTSKQECHGAERARHDSMAFLLRSEEHTSELQSPCKLVCRLLLEKKNK